MNIFELQETLRKTTKILAGEQIEVHLEGFAPRVEYNPHTKKPTCIFIPAITEGIEPKLVDAIHGYIDHECSHIKFSNPEDICDKDKNALWHYIHNCIEDPRVNRTMGKFYPGSQKNIRRGYEYLFDEAGKTDGTPNPYDRATVDALDLSDPKALAQFQLQYSSLWFAGQMNCPLSRNKFNQLDLDRFYRDLIAKADARWIDRLGRIETALDVRQCADYWSEFFSKEALEKMKPNKGGESEGEKSLSDEEVEALMENIDTLEDQLAKEIKKKIQKCAINATERIYWTDRYDKEYSKDDILRKVGRDISITGFEEETKQVTNYLTKDLRRLLEERRRRYYVGGYKSGKINAKSLYSVRLGNDRIFKKKNEVRDVNAAVSLLIDLSGSMSGGKVKTAMQSAYAFSTVLTQLKVPFEIYGFVTDGSDRQMRSEFNKFVSEHGKEISDKIVNHDCPEHIYAFKKFDENFDLLSKKCMTAASDSRLRMIQNEDSKHVMLALKRLSVRPENKKALFVFSDGVPAFTGGNVRNSYDQLKYYGECSKEKFGVDIYSIGIHSSSVKNFYPVYKIVNQLSELPKALFDFLRKVF